jgi:hypothetical protein
MKSEHKCTKNERKFLDEIKMRGIYLSRSNGLIDINGGPYIRQEDFPDVNLNELVENNSEK